MAQQLRIDVRLPHGHWAGDVTRQHPSATLRIEQHMPLSKGRGTARCWSNEDLHATVLNHNGIDTCTDPEDGRFSVTISAGGGGFLRPLVDLGWCLARPLKFVTVGLNGRWREVEKPCAPS